jgi:integrase
VAELIAISELLKIPLVKAFLDSSGRNSIKTRNSYASALAHLQNFLNQKYQGYNCETILKPLLENKISIYELLDSFVSYILMIMTTTKTKISSKSITFYLAALRSYFAYYDVDVIPSKFKRKVKVPKVTREDEQPIDVEDIRKILLSCHNRRLKAYLLVLASGGLRASEGLAIRLKDLDFSASPTRIHIRKEFTKTKVARDIYISDEATRFLKQWLEWKYKNNNNERNSSMNITEHNNPDDDLVFTISNSKIPQSFYPKVVFEFQKLLKVVNMDERKEGMRRRKITLHSFRRFCKSVISNQVNQDYSEWFLGHSKSPYYTIKESERKGIYATKCMKYLTFLDYTTLDSVGKSIEAKLSEKDREIQAMKEKMTEMEKLMHTIGERLEVKVIKAPKK